MSKTRSQSHKPATAPETIQGWASDYYGSRENRAFYEEAFDYITRIISAPRGAVFLDVGCGNCAHSIRLARRGFFVHAFDLSQETLRVAYANIKKMKLANRIGVEVGDITSLSFAKESFSYVLCWGVLMHVPELEKAIGELSRVLRQGGVLIISEGNMRSLDSIVTRIIKQHIGDSGKTRSTPAGIEHWRATPQGMLLVRHTRIQWLIDSFRRHGLIVKLHIAGQFTESYTIPRLAGLARLLHELNRFWFNHVRTPHLAFGNIIVFEKVSA